MICFGCPRHCGAERTENTPSSGFCKMPYNAVLARAALHQWEEPPISGKNGSGAIFFSGCSLRCVFCQNEEISHGGVGKPVSRERFIEIMQELESQGAHNINLVNPTHFTAFLVDVLSTYKPSVPVVYNTGGYDSVESLKALEGLIDIYLPDYKYRDAALAARFSSAPDYPDTVGAAIDEMLRQTGEPRFGNDGMMKRGVIVRHLVLPGHTEDSMNVLLALWNAYGDRIFISIMNQYTPCGTYPDHPELSRRLTTYEYEKVLRLARALGITNGYIQTGDTAKESFIPDFDETGV